MKDKNLTASEQVADEVMKKKKSSANLNFGQENILPGDNSRYLRHALATMNLPPIDISNDDQVQERIIWYFNHCAEDDMKPTVAGLSNSLGVDRKTLYDWKRGRYRNQDGKRMDMIQAAYGLLAELWEDYMMNGKVNPASGIFIGKNHFDYTDEQKVVIEPKNPLGDIDNPDEIRQRYVEDTVEEDILIDKE